MKDVKIQSRNTEDVIFVSCFESCGPVAENHLFSCGGKSTSSWSVESKTAVQTNIIVWEK